jgi:hypothetical protein
MDPNTVLATVTNYGYLLYTRNMLKSLEPFGLDKSIMILCLDQRGAYILRKLGYSVTCADEELAQFCPWNTKGYDKICYLKLKWVHTILSQQKNILLIDGDIVFRKNPLEDLTRWHQEPKVEVWIQNDGMFDVDNKNLCTGYIFLRSNKKMIALYDCAEGGEKYKACALKNNDQTYFNQFVKPHCITKALSLEQYPNGAVFYQNSENLKNSAVLVHFNWVKGHQKMAKMKEHKMWLLTEEEEEAISDA